MTKSQPDLEHQSTGQSLGPRVGWFLFRLHMPASNTLQRLPIAPRANLYARLPITKTRRLLPLANSSRIRLSCAMAPPKRKARGVKLGRSSAAGSVRAK